MARTGLLLVALLGLTAFVAFSESVDCGPGQKSFGNRCYKLYRSAAGCDRDFSFNDARAFCVANGGELASIHTQAQNDFIQSLIKHSTKKCDAKKDFLYWIGLRLTHGPDQFVNGASWTDASPVDYGNPLTPPFQPPFVEGRPEHAHGNGNDEDDGSEVCPPGNAKECVQIFGYGKDLGSWTDAKCDKVHQQKGQCDKKPSGNATAPAGPHHKKHKFHRDESSSSNSEEEGEDGGVDQCRADAATNGFICEFCPAGWTYFNGACYIAVPGARTVAQFAAACSALNASLASIHSDAENRFVAGLASVASPGGTNIFGLRVTHNPPLGDFAPVDSAAYTDGTAVDFGNPIGQSQWGVYPWTPAHDGIPAQPDNRPAPGNVIVQWLNPAANIFSTWDDITLAAADTSGTVTVCKARF